MILTIEIGENEKKFLKYTMTQKNKNYHVILICIN